jgi:hypothetical protein
MNKKKQIIRSARRTSKAKKENNPTAHRKILVNEGGQHNCQYCPPWDFENKVMRKPKRGAKKPRHKDKR